MRINEIITENTESRTEEFHGVHMKLRDDGHEVVASALNDWGNEMGAVVFMKGDNNELDPQDLLVIDKYRGQGIAKVMYDYVTSKGYEIHKSYDVTRIADQGKESGEYFWQKNRGEKRIWEDE
jgi:predicted GNAT family acetyltransferase